MGVLRKLIMSRRNLIAILAVLGPNVLADDLGNIVVIGDSLNAGFQNGTLRSCQQKNSLAQLVAVQAGAPLVLPLIGDPGFPPPIGTLPGMRLNTGAQATNLSVPGQTTGQALTMRPSYVPGFPFAASDPVQILTNLVLGFPGVVSGVSRSQVEWAAALEPDTVIIWLGGNDVLGYFEGIQPGITDPLTFAANLNQVLAGVAAKKRKIVIANIPDVTLLPFMGQVLQANPGLRVQLKALVVAYNIAIAGLAARYNAALVDMYSLVNTLAERGVMVLGQRLTTQASGGLFSLDGIHPTDTGHAILTNEMIKTINARFGLRLRSVDVGRVAAVDPLFPANLTSPPALCTGD